MAVAQDPLKCNRSWFWGAGWQSSDFQAEAHIKAC